MTEDIVHERACVVCGETKFTTDFYRTNQRKDGRRTRCKDCCRDQQTKYCVVEVTVESQRCEGCRITKPAAEFHKSRSKKSGLAGRCKPCVRIRNYQVRHSARGVAYMQKLILEPKELPTSKPCTKCKAVKPATGFYNSKVMKNGLSSHCKQCIAEHAKTDERKKRMSATEKARRQANPEAFRQKESSYNNTPKGRRNHRAWYLKRTYGLTLEDYDQMLKAQNGCCYFCETPANGNLLAVDHCHKTGKVRGLLCTRHNAALGAFGDDPERLEKAKQYLLRNGFHGN